jgi:hypothetical protein
LTEAGFFSGISGGSDCKMGQIHADPGGGSYGEK